VATAIQKTGYKISTGLSAGTFTLLNNPEAEPGRGQTVKGKPWLQTMRRRGRKLETAPPLKTKTSSWGKVL
jgi:hypothetical protein